uniref:Putative pogo family transposase ixodes scapularis pogo family transposase n=1 Tax=Amblyomma triste TaxID=251400 RepID=A0A023G3P3_AMBTT
MGKYVSYTAHFKLKVIHYAKEEGKRAAGRKFGVDERCVHGWCSGKQMFRGALSKGSRACIRKLKTHFSST